MKIAAGIDDDGLAGIGSAWHIVMLWGGRRGWQFRRLHQSMECRDVPAERPRFVEEIVELTTVKHRPTFEICPSDASGCPIIVTWPKGPEQQFDGFATVEAAQAWIENDAPSWIAESIYSTIWIEVQAINTVLG